MILQQQAWLKSGVRISLIFIQKNGWTYLASAMDLHSKKILGYAYDTTMTAELTIKAVTNACLNERDTKGILLHSDIGVQYTSEAFKQCLKERGIFPFHF